MIQIIPINERNENTKDGNNVFYIPNNENLNSMAKKYNYAIENIILKQDDPFVCFKHDDVEFRTPIDVINYKLDKLFSDEKMGVAGLIGTIALDVNSTWWNGVLRAGGRGTYGSGSIIQGNVNEKNEPIEYPMNDHPGIHDYLATLDGCCLFFHKRIFEEGLRFDESLIDYHFYDTDICLQALERGYKVSTTDIVAKHNSVGQPPNNFNELRNVFIQKWDKKVHGEWPISRLSTFYKE